MSERVEVLFEGHDPVGRCQSCQAVIEQARDGHYYVTPHLIELHGFAVDKPVHDEMMWDIICPPSKKFVFWQ
jgi:hypothetical protein